MALVRNITHNFTYNFVKRQLLKNFVYLGGFTSHWVSNVGFYISGSRFSLFIINLRFSLFLIKRAVFFLYRNLYKGNRGLLYDYSASVNFDVFLNRYNFLSIFFHPSEQPFFFGKWFGGLFTNFMVFEYYLEKISIFYYKYYNQLSFYNTWNQKFNVIVKRFPNLIKAYLRQYCMEDFVCNHKQARKKFFDRLLGLAHLLAGVSVLNYYTRFSVRCNNDSFYKKALADASNFYRSVYYGSDIYDDYFKIVEHNALFPKKPHYHKYSFEFMYSEPFVDLSRTKALARIKASFDKINFLPPYDIKLKYKIMRRLILNVYALLFLHEVPHYFLMFDLEHARVAVSECFKYKIPVISLMETDQSLYGIHYPIIANTNPKCLLFFIFLFKQIFFHSRVSKYLSMKYWFKRNKKIKLFLSN